MIEWSPCPVGSRTDELPEIPRVIVKVSINAIPYALSDVHRLFSSHETMEI